MEENGQRGGVSGQDDDLGDTTVQSLGGLVGALLELPVRGLERARLRSNSGR